jgi:hypothetical protein
MPRYSPEELTQRLRLDERTMALVNLDPAPVSVSAHRTAADAYAGTNPVTPGTAGAPPEHYRVVYDFPTLIAKGRFHRPTVVHFDLLGNGGDGYPFAEPICRVVGDQVPWTPHFHRVHPICIGAGWRTDGKTLAVDLLVHVQKLLNFDEPKPTPGYDGWNADAIRWWTREHGCKPLDPSLRYPVVDPNRTSGTGGRRFARAKPLDESRFSPVTVNEPAAAARFAPAGAIR